MSQKIYIVGLALLVMLFAYGTIPDSLKPKLISENSVFDDRTFFPADNPWNREVASEPVDPNSATLLANCGSRDNLHPDFGAFWEGRPIGFVYAIVPGTQPRVPVEFAGKNSSVPAQYPIPPDVPIRGGPKSVAGRHVIVIDKDNWKLYEMTGATALEGGKKWKADSGAMFDLNRNETRLPGSASADPAGLPIFPALVRYDEVIEQGEYHHAVRFTCRSSRRAFVAPASHAGGSQTSPAYPPMGMRVRLKADFDVSGFPAPAQVILIALKKYGMILADHGSPFFISGLHDNRWDPDLLGTLRQVTRDSLEVVKMGPVTTQP